MSEGNILQTDFEGKKYLAKKYLRKKLYCTEKTPVYVGEKRLEVWEKVDVLPKPNTP